jgi:hypothetical protein
VCLIASLFECLVILPAHYLDFGSRRRVGQGDAELLPTSRFARATTRVRNLVDSWIANARGAYERALVPVLEHRVSFAVLIVALGTFAYGYSRNLDVELFPGEFDTFNVLLESPSEYSLDQTEQVVLAMEKPLLEFLGDDVKAISTVIGSSVDSNYDRLSGPNLAMTFVVMKRSRASATAPEKVLMAVKERMDGWAREHPAGVQELRVQARQDGPPIGSPVELRIQGSDYATCKLIAQEVAAYLETLPGVINVEDNPELDDGPLYENAYLVFGVVKTGLSVLHDIAQLKTYDARLETAVPPIPSPEEFEQVPVFDEFTPPPDGSDLFVDPCTEGDTACLTPTCDEVSVDELSCEDPRCLELIPLTEEEEEEISMGGEVPRLCATPALPPFPILVPEPGSVIGLIGGLLALAALNRRRN